MAASKRFELSNEYFFCKLEVVFDNADKEPPKVSLNEWGSESHLQRA